MWAIVKFKGQEPVLFGLSNSGHAYRLSTMADVEWVAGATLNSSGTLLPVIEHKVGHTSALYSTVIKPFEPGEPDPWAEFRNK